MKHGSGGRPGKGGRQMTPDEAELWRRLTHSLDKVKTKPRVAAHGGDAGAAPAGPAAVAQRPAGARRTAPGAPAVPPIASPAPPAKAPPAEFDRRTLRQLAGGKAPIDATLDLHGLRQDAAHARFRAFLVSCQAKGHRMVLVVTGKGGGRQAELDDTPRGVLRRSVPLWLAEPELRAVVVGYAAAGARHGGDGALYIRLRKAR